MALHIGLFIGTRRGYEVLKSILSMGHTISFIFCLIEDLHEHVRFSKQIIEIAKKNAIPFFTSDSVNPSGYKNILRQFSFDIIFVVGWRYLIPKENFKLPSRGMLIIHDSLLPSYRGFAPLNWALVNGERKVGATIFYIDEEVDAGDIVRQISIPVFSNDNATSIDKKMTSAYIELVRYATQRLSRGQRLPRRKQDHRIATYCCKRVPGDGRIHWERSTKEIHNLIRGLTHPYPGAFTFMGGKKIFIWKATPLKNPPRYVGRVFGRIVKIVAGEGVYVLTGDGILVVNIMHIDGEQEVSADRIVKSIKTTFI